jgi:serine/threonine-protein kinase
VVSSSDERVIAGRYRLGSVLGRGGMGRVYTAEDQHLGRPVAVKLLRDDLSADPPTRQRFEREALLAARVGHPHIVTIYDTGEDDGVPFIVMELLPGRNLADEIASGPLRADRLHQVAREVLSAMDAAHRHGVLHRDIKPSNVLIAANAQVKVTDFGIAKTTDDLSQTTALLGTAAYLAPERLAGHPATIASDLFSFGVVLYESATGSNPFAAATPLATVHAITHGTIAPLASIRPDLDAPFMRAVERAMQKDPAQRFESAQGMADALDNRRPATEMDQDSTLAITQPDQTAALPAILPPHALGQAPPRHAGHLRRVRLAITLAILVIAIALVVWAANRDSSTTPPTTQPRSVATSLPTTTPPISRTTVPQTQAQPGNGRGNGHGKDK